MVWHVLRWGMVGSSDAPFPDPSHCSVLSGARLGGEDGHAVGVAQRPEEGAIAQVERNGGPFFAVDTDSNSNVGLEVGWVELGLWVLRP